MRGRSINASVIFIDEAQNLEIKDFLTCITRMGKFSKVIIAGDTRQSDIKHSGFLQVYNLFDNPESLDNGIVTFKFGIEDIMRDPSLQFIIKKFEALSS
jgi:phosphate starvation-inducible PhoH-like protein